MAEFTKEEEVWLREWGTASRQGMTLTNCSIMADACLLDFLNRFPQKEHELKTSEMKWLCKSEGSEGCGV